MGLSPEVRMNPGRDHRAEKSGYFSKKKFVDGICALDLHVIGKLRRDAKLRHLYPAGHVGTVLDGPKPTMGKSTSAICRVLSRSMRVMLTSHSPLRWSIIRSSSVISTWW